MITDLGLIGKINDALQKVDDANTKLCDVFTSSLVDTDDLLQIKRSINHLAEATTDASRCLPPVP